MGGLPIIGGLIQFIVGEVSSWAKGRTEIKKVELEAKIATIRAQSELAAYKAKADTEWDLKWAGSAETSWKDEWIMILWSIPLVVFILALFIPPLRDNVESALDFAKTIHPQIFDAYGWGWVIIFSATLGLKSITNGITNGMLGSRVEKITAAFSKVEDDIPDEAVKKAQAAISKAFDDNKSP